MKHCAHTHTHTADAGTDARWRWRDGKFSNKFEPNATLIAHNCLFFLLYLAAVVGAYSPCFPHFI